MRVVVGRVFGLICLLVCCDFGAANSQSRRYLVEAGKFNSGTPAENALTRNRAACGLLCLHTDNCVSANHNQGTGALNHCEMFYEATEITDNLSVDSDKEYLIMKISDATCKFTYACFTYLPPSNSDCCRLKNRHSFHCHCFACTFIRKLYYPLMVKPHIIYYDNAWSATTVSDNCWSHLEDLNLMHNQFPAPHQADGDGTWYWPEPDTRQSCAEACDQEDECAAYTWIPPGISGWSGCYGMADHRISESIWTSVYSGRKISCATAELPP